MRGAIYTRKSTTEGLDQAFSLDAKREASEAYIASQMSLGWQGSPNRHDGKRAVKLALPACRMSLGTQNRPVLGR